MGSKYAYNDEAVNNLRLEDTSILDRLIDHEAARQAHLKKRHDKYDKRMSLKEAVAKFVEDGDVVGETGFGYVRTPIQVNFEICRQGKRNLQYIGSPNTNQTYVIAANACAYSHNSYTGAEMRGTDRMYGRLLRDERVRILSEWSHGSMGMGFKAAQMGANFITCKQMLGSDMIKYNPYVKVVDDPFSKTKDPVCLVPALHPDVTFIHCQQADMYGNARIFGPTVNDVALAFAAKKVIITCEEVVPELDMRFNTQGNVIPFMVVDAVVELPFGCLPGCCPGYYYWAREWWEWLMRIACKDYPYLEPFMDYWILGPRDQYEFIDRLAQCHGGYRYIDNLRRIERAEAFIAEDQGVDFEYQQVIPIWEKKEG